MKKYLKSMGFSLLTFLAVVVFMPIMAHAYAFTQTVDMQKTAEGSYFFDGEAMSDDSDAEDYVVYHKFSVGKTALIEIYGDEEYIDLAHETFEYIISKDEKDILTYGVMGDVFRKNGLYEDAKNLYEKAIELDTQKEANYYSEWLECMLKLKPLRSIKKYLPLATIAKDRMNTPFAYIKSSRISRLTKDYATAFNLLRQALKVPRCKGCFYSVCHRVIYEQAVLYEKQRNYSM